MSKPEKHLFRFKKFDVDQRGCIMKLNTDGVLLGALAEAEKPQTILDIGTGTGVIALMLAQRFATAKIDAVEVDEEAAVTATSNFNNSPFADKLTAYAMGFADFFKINPENKYDLIISNPPFYIDALASPSAVKNLAKHAGAGFFEELISVSLQHLSPGGILWLVLPVNTAALVKSIAAQRGLHLQKNITLHSFKTDAAHREILSFGVQQLALKQQQFVIYNAPKVYSEQYQRALANFFIVF
ncbi:methyltransferase [Mucilaginibacter hurinus]|uniref:tRNA1(Val) (adenine(37)-N6)-methyltransferase n=1 Tax=Mucilaginibacter hurinus TaxID=2201324 RepID=A0A367GP50_9SPHI|nr:methyltransferase [Mucilaginibacter hurinus]RCH55080.1 methyltransferase [Mucilaginibacter hurinus]